jgi:hypothetical protein
MRREPLVASTVFGRAVIIMMPRMILLNREYILPVSSLAV